jgi:hypothetical protein
VSRVALNISVPVAQLGRKLLTGLACLATILFVDCEISGDGGLNPSAPSALASLLVGQWSSSSSASTPAQDSCADLQWSATQEEASTYSGAFSATCGTGAEVEGTLTGILVDDQLVLTGVGTATPVGSIGCDLTLDTTACVVGDAIQLDYAGSTCLGPVSGTEVLAQF